ncbi:WhiB family transcriptional regulator [Kibdelosporangium aridum]|uniref:WhiB family transcriptional regulator n=1 Tax=Kibdelosporangium aridum TaxID=2030 RepID=A0A428Y9A6_KIBAR|nr:WhiB family transcriptional regulator [Kibdelosporangium aridum]RSM64101.1 WhiB family transcriptional regulator [Kibdelosporangium aridum]
MSTPNQDCDRWLVGIAWRLDRLRWIPDEALTHIVLEQGECVSAYTNGEAPTLTGRDATDRELAAQLCATCPVQDECLELELRTAGERTFGVWGALAEDDRRALYPHWRQRGERATDLVDLCEDVEEGEGQ